LPTAKARDDYFKQQSTFVTKEGSDEYTEFSTSIQGKWHAQFCGMLLHVPTLTLFSKTVKGFRRRMLAVRPVEGVPSTKLFRLHLFWIFTLIGLTVPYRIWFARHCDELRVTVVKETASGKTGSSSWSWFSRSSSDQSAEWNKEFKSKMRELALYATGEGALPLIVSSNETKFELPSTIEEEKGSEVEVVAINETFSDTLNAEDSNSTESKTKGDDDKEKEQPELPLPPPPTTTESDAAIETATDNKASDESPVNDKEQ
jgi:hypothetical protein